MSNPFLIGPKKELSYDDIVPQDGSQYAMLTSNAEELFMGGEAGGGKAESLSNLIPTVSGWVTMGTIRVGDQVFDENGKPCNVTHLYKVMVGRPCFEVVFSDGHKIVCDADHEWFTTTDWEREQAWKRSDEFKAARRAARPSRAVKGTRPWLTECNRKRGGVGGLASPLGGIRTTKEIADSLYIDNRVNHAVAVAMPLNLPEIPVPLDPYVLGAWLGDGNTSGGVITSVDQPIIEELRKRGEIVTVYPSDKIRFGIKGLTSRLRKVGLKGHKHIPSIYLRSSFSQRLDLLRGLMDTDGYSGDQKMEFTTTLFEMKENVCELLSSMGIKWWVSSGNATLYGRITGPKWRIFFVAPFICFNLPRKVERQKLENLRTTTQLRYITAVNPVESVPVRCISVDSPSHLYLSGRGMIPTHNSFGFLLDFLEDYEKPAANGLYLRRHYSDLEGVMHDAHMLYKGYGAVFNGDSHAFIFPSGARLRMGHMNNANDVYNYTGNQRTHYYWDELPQFPQMPYLLLMAWLRGGSSDIFKRIRASGNPDGEGFLWVKSRFIDKLKPFEKAYFTKDNNRDTKVPVGTPGAMLRQFIPCYREENLALMKNDPGYRDRLEQLPEDKKRAYKYGIWDYLDRPMQLIKTKWFSDALSGNVSPSRGLAAMGADYAESGDLCTMASGVGGQLRKFMEWPGMDGLQFGDLLLKEAEEIENEHGHKYFRMGVDSIGPGTVLYHYLRKTRFGDRLDPIRYKDPNFTDTNKSFTIRMKFNNLRSQMAWKLREDFQYGRIDLSPLQAEKNFYNNIHLLQEEVLAHTYKETNGLIQIVSKDDLRKSDSLGRSPDRFDALAIWNWVREKARKPPDPAPKTLQEILDRQAQRNGLSRRNFDWGVRNDPLEDMMDPRSWEAG